MRARRASRGPMYLLGQVLPTSDPTSPELRHSRQRYRLHRYHTLDI